MIKILLSKLNYVNFVFSVNNGIKIPGKRYSYVQDIVISLQC